jgi:glycosyltransferase involved in cell wall biosynthesis/SAM-dependent methyltransferase
MSCEAGQADKPADAHEAERRKWEKIYADLPVKPESEALLSFGAEFVRLVKELLPDGGRVLEAGCGGATLSAALARTGLYETHLMDFSQGALGLARRRFEQAKLEAQFVHGDLFEPGRPEYDLVFNAGVLEHYDPADQVRLLRGMGSRSRQYVMVLVPNRQCYWYWLWRLWQAGSGKWPYGKEVPALNVEEVFKEAGLNFLGQAFVAESWTENFILSLPELGENLKKQILQIHRQPVIPGAHKAYLLAALGSTTEPVGSIPSVWARCPDAAPELDGRWASALVDSLAQQLQLQSELAQVRKQWQEKSTQTEKLLENLQRALQRKDALLSRLRLRYREKARQANQLAGLCEGHESLVRQLSLELEGRAQEAGALREKLSSSELAQAELREQTEKLRRELAEAQQKAATLEQTLQARDRELSVLRSDATTARIAHQNEAELASLRQARQELERKLRFANERIRELSAQLQQLWDSPTWQLLNRLHNSRYIGGAWRAFKAVVPAGIKEKIKNLIRPRGSKSARSVQTKGSRTGQPVGTGRREGLAAGDDQTWPSEAAVIEGLQEYLRRVETCGAQNLVFFVAGVKFVESEGQRVTQIIRELVGHGTPTLLTYFRWQNEYGQRVPRPHDPRFFQIPMDIFERHRQRLLDWRPDGGLVRTAVFEFPHPLAFQLVNELNLAGWNTVYDIIDDWEEFHAAGKAVWYEPAVEQYLCANCHAVTAIVPLLAEKVRAWVPGLEVEIVPNGVSPDSFNMKEPRRPLARGEVTVGYFGYLTRAWFDWELVAGVARRRPAWRFYIIGYGENPGAKLPDNVQLLGKVPHHQLYGYAQNWDVGIVPFRAGALSRGADPIKVYEYLALGLPVVTTEIPHLRSYPGVHVARSAAEFEALLEKAARTGLDRPAVEEFVRKSTWYRRGLALIEAGRRGRQNRRLSGALLAGVPG